MSPLDNVRVLEFPEKCQPGRGCLTVLEETAPCWPFPIKRVFYITDVPADGTSRGGHAHRFNSQVLICVAGAFDLHLSDGSRRIEFHLDSPSKGVLVPAGVWNEMHNFTPGTVLLVLCSHTYSPENYLNDFAEYKNYIKETYGNEQEV